MSTQSEFEEPPGRERPPQHGENAPLLPWHDWGLLPTRRLNGKELAQVIHLPPEEAARLSAPDLFHTSIISPFASLADPPAGGLTTAPPTDPRHNLIWPVFTGQVMEVRR
jgi:hypothetical protein